MRGWEQYKRDFLESINAFDFDKNIIQVISDSVKHKQTIFVCGNGGSASISNHMACDFSKIANNNFRENRYKIMSLVSDVNILTAISNDNSYDDVFSEQLLSHSKKNDILILISSSGNSPNIVKALNVAKQIGLITIGICGFDGGYLFDNSDYKAYVNCNQYGIVEDIHSVFAHFLSYTLKENDK